LLPGPVLKAQYPDLAVWDWSYANPFRWNAYDSLDGGVTWRFDDFEDGDTRQYAPDGNEPMFIVGVDANGREITERSNVVQVEDAPPPLLTDLVAYWKLDETSGTRADATGNGHDLADIHNDTGSGAGIIGNGADFSTTTYGLVSLGPGIQGGDMTVSFWVNSPGMNDNQINIFYQSYDLSIYYYFDGDQCPGTSITAYADAGACVYDGVQNASPTGWFHIVGVRRGNQLEIYRNGVRRYFYDPYHTDLLVGDLTSPGWPDQFIIGNSGGGYFVHGMMDEVGVWSRALTVDEIELLYNDGSGLAYEDF
jgi:hypothetical protein